ncbi:glycyl-tRNA synthetase [Basidiobolus meristosporus CBS 931.73]|uniref:glycine--tRNA ligase n=1 Tax=Basidiobolus meristosporus CBS 931.73 TaxID=1314790 RepID=A0A1Y1Y9C7_9FUNG|nr:glycyl-tRNA synthetase [Basidiobolus meristosporus CBS 931.73]|eukprot:ORX94495.1 glycyl-tRNA synthetase [Basidiobolus meristosporus CBS 931.73]
MAAKKFDRSSLEQLLSKRFFYTPAFSIYGGVAGLYDYGPTGCALQANILNTWRNHFVLEEDMLELDCTIMTPAEVLKTSGHVEKFADWMCKDPKTGEIFRADHLVEGVLEGRLEGDKLARSEPIAAEAACPEGAKKKKEKKKKGAVVAVKLEDSVKAEYEHILAQIDNYSGPELGELMKKYDIKSPETGNDLTEPVEFNLMFESSIGPTGQLKGYLRPETAQGQFLNFKRLLEFNNDRMPFASAQIGKSFRNEISPRSGLLRVREFTMAEIEHYVDPLSKKHARFAEVKDQVVRLLPASVQLEGRTELSEITIGEAVEKKIVDNETLGYFLVRIYLFLTKIGINPERLRFRQHMSNEMAHYACDCWDAEIETSYGWIECVGCADRSAYDLTVHSVKTKEKLVVREALPEPRVIEKLQVEINKKVFGSKLKRGAKPVEEYLTALDEAAAQKLKDDMAANGGKINVTGTDGNEYEVTSEMVSVEKVTIKEHVREYTPNVIEPSFGIGRIMYSLMEHAYWTREGDEQRSVLSFPIGVAPFKCLVLPISNQAEFQKPLQNLTSNLRRLGISSKIDDSSASIGRRYARNDELGTPYAITVDFQTVADGTVTLRERDTTKQIREKVEVILELVNQLVAEKITWEQVLEKHQVFVQQEVAN